VGLRPAGRPPVGHTAETRGVPVCVFGAVPHHPQSPTAPPPPGDESTLNATNAPQARLIGSLLADRANTFALTTTDPGAVFLDTVFLDTKESTTTAHAATLGTRP
jgi:hypothetical protein